jgi:hypothetical protein
MLRADEGRLYYMIAADRLDQSSVTVILVLL